MWLRRLFPKLFLITGFLLLFLIFRYQNSLKDLWQVNFEKLKIYTDNFFFQFDPALERNRPTSLVERQEELKVYIGEPFISFTNRDWDKFWHIIYGGFLKENRENPDLPKKMRQLDHHEIMYELASLYPQPFAFFQDSHWRIFFGIILKK